MYYLLSSTIIIISIIIPVTAIKSCSGMTLSTASVSALTFSIHRSWNALMFFRADSLSRWPAKVFAALTTWSERKEDRKKRKKQRNKERIKESSRNVGYPGCFNDSAIIIHYYHVTWCLRDSIGLADIRTSLFAGPSLVNEHTKLATWKKKNEK